MVELLVTIGVIAVLASLLFPSLRSMAERSQSATALSNLRSIGTAVLTYAGEHNNQIIPVYFFPAGQTSGGADRAWIHELVQNGYIEDRIATQDSSGKWVNSHTYSRLYDPITRKKYPNAMVSGGFGLNIFLNAFEGYPLQKLSSPGKIILAADASFKAGWFDWGLGDANGVNIYPNTIGGGYAHYLFCDGHTERIKARNPDQVDSLPVGYNETVFLVPPESR